MKTYSVEVIANKTGEVVKTVKCGSEMYAKTLMNAFDFDLDHEEYITRVVYEDVE